MKVLRDTDDQLIVENNPVLLAILLCGFFMVFIAVGLFSLSSEPFVGILFTCVGLGMGAVFVVAFIRRTQVILDRSRNLVELRRKSLRGYTSRTWDLQYLDQAVVQTSSSDSGTTRRVALVINGGMDAGTHPVTLVYASGGGAERARQAINGWLDRARLDSTPPRA